MENNIHLLFHAIWKQIYTKGNYVSLLNGIIQKKAVNRC